MLQIWFLPLFTFIDFLFMECCRLACDSSGEHKKFVETGENQKSSKKQLQTFDIGLLHFESSGLSSLKSDRTC